MTALSRIAEERLRKPRCRGAFRPIDAARRQLGLLSVGDGNARLFWLIDMQTQVVADARFIAFGPLSSHPIADAFTQLVRNRSVAEACAIPASAVESLLRDDATAPAFSDPSPLAFLAGLQAQALAELPAVRLLPKPEEKRSYVRKRKQDWDAHDQAWLPLSLLKKIAAVDKVLKPVLASRAPGASHRVEGLHDDFRVVLLLDGVASESTTILQAMLGDALTSIHPQLTAEFP